MIKSLKDLFVEHGANKCAEHGTIYDDLFSEWRDDPMTLLEIGVCRGGSLKAFRDYFSAAMIVGVDKDDHCTMTGESRITFLLGDITDSSFVNGIIDMYNGFDVIVDDGSHTANEQQAALEALFPACRRLYVIEDLHTMQDKSYIPDGFISTIDYIEPFNPVFFKCHGFDRDIAVMRKRL